MRMVVAGENTADREEYRKALLQLGIECSGRECVSFSDLRLRLSQPPRADLVLVCLDPQNPAEGISALSSVRAQIKVPVLTVGAAGDLAAVAAAKNAGAEKYLDRDRFRDELETTLQSLEVSGVVDLGRGRTIAVVSPYPGSGVTTVASGLAFSFAEKHPGHVILAELNNTVPELAINLDLNVTHSIGNVIQEKERMDAAMIRQALVHHANGVEVLAYPAETMQTEPITPEVMRILSVLLRSISEISVLDLGYGQSLVQQEAMRLAEAVVILIRLDVPGLRLARKYVKDLLQQGYAPEKLRLLPNRYGQRGQVPWSMVGKVLPIPTPDWLPDDPGALNKSVNRGQPLVAVARGCSLNRRLRALAMELDQLTAPPASKR